jgi:hypothetical protein
MENSVCWHGLETISERRGFFSMKKTLRSSLLEKRIFDARQCKINAFWGKGSWETFLFRKRRFSQEGVILKLF